MENKIDNPENPQHDAKLPVSGWLHLTDEQTKILADLGSQFIYKGVNDELRITEFGILEIFHKYNELVGNRR